jgi:hypothetical protein
MARHLMEIEEGSEREAISSRRALWLYMSLGLRGGPWTVIPNTEGKEEGKGMMSPKWVPPLLKAPSLVT